MIDTDNEKSRPFTLFGIKENMKHYSLSKLRYLSSILIDSLDDLLKDKENLKKTLEKYDEEVIELSVQVAKVTNKKAKLKEDLKKCEEKWWSWVCK